MLPTNDHRNRFHIPLSNHLLTLMVHRCRPLWIRMGNLETRQLHGQLTDVTVDRPVYVTGLARSGTTLLLEYLSSRPDFAFHRYRDFHGIFVPYWWRQGCKPCDSEPQERAHGDRLQVTPDSPEAMEECLWMAFFRQLHDPGRSHVLGANSTNARFERFYRDHIYKLMLAHNRQRYLAKNNYNLTRVKYLLKLFPDARFVVAVRHPRSHIASLIKQHRLFCEAESQYPRALAYMRHVGHYEFGLDRRPIHTPDVDKIRQVRELWRAGEEVRGWARYWATLYGWFAAQLADDRRLKQSVEIVRYEDLCNAPESTLGRVREQCEIADDGSTEAFSKQIAAPAYYCPSFTQDEEAAIVEETNEVAQLFGYSPSDSTGATFEIRGGVSPCLTATF